MSIGLTDKLHWRRIGPAWCCFKSGWVPASKGQPQRNGLIVSLCGDHELPKMFGGACSRPPAIYRCAKCDGLEMERRGKEESLPESPNWETIRGVDYSSFRILTHVPYAPSRRPRPQPRGAEPGNLPRNTKRSRAVGGRRSAHFG